MTVKPGGMDMTAYYNGRKNLPSPLGTRNAALGEIDFRTLIDIKKASDVMAYANQQKAAKAPILAKFKAEVIALIDEASAAELAETDRMANNEIYRRSIGPGMKAKK